MQMGWSSDDNICAASGRRGGYRVSTGFAVWVATGSGAGHSITLGNVPDDELDDPPSLSHQMPRDSVT